MPDQGMDALDGNSDVAGSVNWDYPASGHVGQVPFNSGRACGAGERVSFSPEGASRLKAQTLDLASIRGEGYGYERLDQLTMELLLGVR